MERLKRLALLVVITVWLLDTKELSMTILFGFKDQDRVSASQCQYGRGIIDPFAMYLRGESRRHCLKLIMNACVRINRNMSSNSIDHQDFYYCNDCDGALSIDSNEHPRILILGLFSWRLLFFASVE